MRLTLHRTVHNAGMTLTTLWPDGTIIQGETWQELEENLRDIQWHDYTPLAFRQEMKRRAAVMTGEVIDIATPELMFRELERVGMVRIEQEG